MKRRAIIGDVHGCIEEFKELYSRLEWLSIDEVCQVGDLVDRGPDSGACVQFAMEKKMTVVLGNHEDSIIRLWDRKAQDDPNRDLTSHKQVTLSQMNDTLINYMKSLPKLHVFDDSKLIIVHGGLFPLIELHQQPLNVIRAQLIYPYPSSKKNGDVRWWGQDAMKHKSKKTEEESRKEGFVRWYEAYDREQDVVYGHSVFVQPHIHQNPGKGRTIGVDTGNVFGGVLTAVVHGERNLFFISVPPKKVYCEDKMEKFKV